MRPNESTDSPDNSTAEPANAAWIRQRRTVCVCGHTLANHFLLGAGGIMACGVARALCHCSAFRQYVDE